jgi:CDP-glycerol glycerophosphotransferase
MSCDNILVVDSQTDPYPLLQLSDSLITDYSSIYFDFLLTKKPIIFFPYDYEEYLVESRELYFDYEKYTPGVKVKSMKDLEVALLAEDRYEKERLALKNIVFDDSTCFASERLYKEIKSVF